MPTVLPTKSSPRACRRGRPLTRAQAVWFYWLFGCAMVLDVQLHAAQRRVGRLGLDVAGDDLLRLAHRWLARQDAIIALLEIEEPAAVAQVRIAIRREHPPGDGPGR